MKTANGIWMGLLVGAMVLGTGCKTMSTGDTRPTPSAPDTGGAGLDPNPDHNIPNAPGGIDGDPMNPNNNPNAPVNSPTMDGTMDGAGEPGVVPPMP